MIVDNADDGGVLSSPGIEPRGIAHASEHLGEATALASFLPQAQSEWLLVTSRNLVAALNLVGPKHNVIQVEPMIEEVALRLLKTRITVSKSFEGDARALVQALEGIPLAITHAAAYVAMREPRIDVSTFIKLYHESKENQTYLLNIPNVRDLRRDSSVSDTVITTWQMSFEHIRKINQAAADLLSLMAMCDRHGVPEYLLYDGRSRLQFDDAVTPLTSFSLIRTQAGKPSRQQRGDQSFEMHSLVQLSTRKWLELNDELGKWRKASIRIMVAIFPNGKYETWPSCQILLPHSKKVLGYSPGCEEGTIDQASIADKTTRYLLLIGEYELAENISRNALKASEAVLGAEHSDTLGSISNLGMTLERQGKYDEAEAMHRRALKVSEKVLGPEHSGTRVSISNLGSTLERQGKYDEAEAMHRRALAGSEKMLGAEHPDTLSIINYLGLTLESQGKYDEAEAMHRRALAGLKKVFGAEHSYTLSSINSLGSVLKSQGKYDEAETMHRQALAGREKMLGPEHPDTYTIVNSLAVTLHERQQHDAASELYQRACNGLTKTLGSQHPLTIACYKNYSLMKENAGKHLEDNLKPTETLPLSS